jgi:hypothetical protein
MHALLHMRHARCRPRWKGLQRSVAGISDKPSMSRCLLLQSSKNILEPDAPFALRLQGILISKSSPVVPALTQSGS